jgi:hypothetical protein
LDLNPCGFVRAAFCTVLFALRGLYVLIYFFNLVFFFGSERE